MSASYQVENGLQQVAEIARKAFGQDAPGVLRKWAQERQDNRWIKAAELLEKQASR